MTANSNSQITTQRTGTQSGIFNKGGLGCRTGNPLKVATKVATKFNIKSDACAEKHVNVVNNYLKGSSGDAKTGKILEQLQPKKQKL